MQPEITYQPNSASGNFIYQEMPVTTEDHRQLDTSDNLSHGVDSSLTLSESTEVNTGTQIQPIVSTAAQMRSRLLQRENNLLVGGSRYMEPRADALIAVAMASPQPQLQLPQRVINHVNYDWLTVVLLISVALFASIRTSWNKYMMNLFLSVTNYSTSNRMFQEKNTSLQQGSFQLNLLFYIIFSAFLYQLLTFFRTGLPFRNFYLYLASLILVVGYFAFKKTVYLLMGYIIDKRFETGEYLFHAGNFKKVTGLILIPVVAIIAFFPFGNMQIPVLAGLIIVSLLYFTLILRGFIILLKKQFSIFYLFLYFCTLEILPLVLLYRILVK